MEGEEEKLSTFRLAEETTPERFLVSDDGLFIVAFDSREWPSGGHKGNTLIYRADGGLVARLTLDDLLTPGDLEVLRRTWSISSCGDVPGRLSASLDNGRDLLILTIKDSTIPHEIAIDLKTGKLLTPRRDLLPQLRVKIGSYPATGDLEPVWGLPVCVGGSEVIKAKTAFVAADLIRQPPHSFYAHAIERPLPKYTELAKRARLQAKVEVEVIVSETGRVACARVHGGAMGLGGAAEAVALLWRFQPFDLDGKPVRAIGRFSFRFGLVDPPGAP